MESHAKLLLLDTSNLYWRSYHGLLHQRFEQDGVATWGVYGTVNTIAACVREHHPTHLVSVFDQGKSEYRLNIFPEYKAGRPQSVENLDFEEAYSQLEMTQDLLPKFGVQVWKEQGIEADDIIATLAERFSDEATVIIVSGDKDLKQLVGPNVTLHHPSLGSQGSKVWTHDAVLEEYGVPPTRLPEIWALSGDKVDNVPGVPGIGEKTAIKFIRKYGDLSHVALSEEKKIQGYRADMRMSYDLVKLNPELSSFDLDLHHIRFLPVAPSDTSSKELSRSLHELGFDSVLSRWNQGTLWSERGVRLRDLQK